MYACIKIIHKLLYHFVLQVFYKRWSKIVSATLIVLIEILVFKLREWTGYVLNRVDGFYDGLMFSSIKSTEGLTSAIRVVGKILGIVIAELFNTLKELLGIDLTAAISDLVREYLVTGPNYLESIALASNATIATTIKPSELSTARAGQIDKRTTTEFDGRTEKREETIANTPQV